MKKFNKIIKNSSPLVSVVIPVFNAEKFIKEALMSMVNQTYQNLEIVVVDDCSTDESWKIVSELSKKYANIKIARNSTNSGIAKTVNRAIRLTKGEYLARLDADDIAMPYRISQELLYLQSHPDVVAVGGQCQIIDENSRLTGFKNFPLSFEQIYKFIYFYVPLQQSTLMVARKRLPRRAVYYREDMVIAEEIELFFQMFQYGKVENLPDYLVLYRLHSNNNSFKNVKRIFWLTLVCRVRAVLRYGYKPSSIGIIVTLLQLGLVIVLPERGIVWLYKSLRDFRSGFGVMSILIRTKLLINNL